MIDLKKNHDLSQDNTLRLSCCAEYFIQAYTTQDYIAASEFADKQHKNLMLLADGSNVLLPPKLDCVVLQPCNAEVKLISEDENVAYIKVGAGHSWHQWVLESLKQSYYGLENLALIPGRVGAAPVQNIGAYGVEVGELIDQVHCVDLKTKTSIDFFAKDCQFSYRNSLFKRQPNRYMITAVTFKLFKQPQLKIHYAALQSVLNADTATPQAVADAVIQIRQSKLPDPAVLANAGSFFKNPIATKAKINALLAQFPQLPVYAVDAEHAKVAAGWLIEQAGLKGCRFGQIGTYERQALVLVNYQPANLNDIISAYQAIQASVYQKFAMMLEPEPVLYAQDGKIAIHPNFET